MVIQREVLLILNIPINYKKKDYNIHSHTKWHYMVNDKPLYNYSNRLKVYIPYAQSKFLHIPTYMLCKCLPVTVLFI